MAPGGLDLMVNRWWRQCSSDQLRQNNLYWDVSFKRSKSCDVTATRKSWKNYCSCWLTSIDSMKIMQMTFINTQSILMKLLLNSKADFFLSCLEIGLTHCSMTQWPAANTKVGQISGIFCCLVVRHLFNLDFLQITTCDIFEIGFWTHFISWWHWHIQHWHEQQTVDVGIWQCQAEIRCRPIFGETESLKKHKLYCTEKKEKQFWLRLSRWNKEKSLMQTRKHCALWLLQIMMLKRLNMVISWR